MYQNPIIFRIVFSKSFEFLGNRLVGKILYLRWLYLTFECFRSGWIPYLISFPIWKYKTNPRHHFMYMKGSLFSKENKHAKCFLYNFIFPHQKIISIYEARNIKSKEEITFLGEENGALFFFYNNLVLVGSSCLQIHKNCFELFWKSLATIKD